MLQKLKAQRAPALPTPEGNAAQYQAVSRIDGVLKALHALRAQGDRSVLSHTGPHTTAFAWCTPLLEDFTFSPGDSLRPSPLAFNPDTPRRLSTPLLTPFNSTPISSLRMDPRPSAPSAARVCSG
jgi:hypothetical protein